MKNILNYEKLNYIPDKLYHFTLSKNIESIYNDSMLKADMYGYVYLTETIEDAEIFANRYASIRNTNIKEFSIIEIDTSEIDINLNDLYISTDHNTDYFAGARAIAYNGDLEIFDFIEYNFN